MNGITGTGDIVKASVETPNVETAVYVPYTDNNNVRKTKIEKRMLNMKDIVEKIADGSQDDIKNALVASIRQDAEKAVIPAKKSLIESVKKHLDAKRLNECKTAKARLKMLMAKKKAAKEAAKAGKQTPPKPAEKAVNESENNDTRDKATRISEAKKRILEQRKSLKSLTEATSSVIDAKIAKITEAKNVIVEGHKPNFEDERKFIQGIRIQKLTEARNRKLGISSNK